MKKEYLEIKISSAIDFYIKHGLKKKDWSLVAVDVMRDLAVLRRYENEKRIERDKNE